MNTWHYLVVQSAVQRIIAGGNAVTRTCLIIVCPMQCMALDKHKITWVSVCLSEIPIVLDRDRSFCPIFLKFGMQVTHLTTKSKFDGR